MANIDIDASYYKTGTATVAANGTVVTGQGTQWNSSVRAGDLFGTHVGMPTRILTVNSNTQLTLAYPWKGPAQTAAAYEIQFTPYDTGYYPAVRKLLQTMASGNVEALASLTGSANKGLMFTGAGTLDLFDINAGARNFLATFSPTSPVLNNSVIPPRISSNVGNSSVTDANLALESGWYYLPTASINTPIASTGFINVIARTDQILKQLWYQQVGNRRFSRFCNSGTWSAWVEDFTVVDSANNGYIRLDDRLGTIIQRGVYWTGNGTTVTFPMAFPNSVRMVLATISQRPNGDTPLIVMTGGESLTGFTAHTRNSSNGALVTATIYWEAWGH